MKKLFFGNIYLVYIYDDESVYKLAGEKKYTKASKTSKNSCIIIYIVNNK